MDIVMGGGLRNATAYITVQVVMEVLRYDFFRRYEQQHARDVVIMCLNTTRQFLFYTWPTLVANLTINNTVVEASRKLFDDILDGVVDHMNRAHWLELPSRLEATRKVRLRAERSTDSHCPQAGWLAIARASIVNRVRER